MQKNIAKNPIYSDEIKKLYNSIQFFPYSKSSEVISTM